MEFFKCPVCYEKIKVTSEGINHSGSNPFHFFKYSKDELEALHNFEVEGERRLLYGEKTKFPEIEQKVNRDLQGD